MSAISRSYLLGLVALGHLGDRLYPAPLLHQPPRPRLLFLLLVVRGQQTQPPGFELLGKVRVPVVPVATGLAGRFVLPNLHK